MRAMLCALLTRTGFEVAPFENGRVLIAELERAHHDEAVAPCVVVSDVQMPGVGGLDVLHVTQRLFPNVPVILITAFGDEQTHRRARELGARAVLDKPFDLSAFRRLITEAAGERPSRERS